MRIGGVIVVIWLLIGVAAGIQRGYFAGSTADCTKLGTTVVTVLAGPLNYVGLNPKVECKVPQPSK